MATAEFFSTSYEQTRELGERIGKVLQPGDVLVLNGDLGAGKTQLTKGIARALGIREEITSPTFAIQAIHEGSSMTLYHFDLYRLSSADELGPAGVWDVLGADGVCVLEWGEQFADELGEERLDVYVTRLEDEAAPRAEPAAGNVLAAGNEPLAGDEPARKIELISHDKRGDDIIGSIEGWHKVKKALN